MNAVLNKPALVPSQAVPLSDVRESGWVVVLSVNGDRAHGRRLNEMGLFAGASVHVKSADGRGAMIVQLESSSLALDRSLAADVQVLCTR